ncbi:MAG: hypothetical protein NTY09_14420 [bacterium]|jgi:hypothetical protein|nr:hypothetical protein [bacterium]
MKRKRLDFRSDDWPAFIFMHVIFFVIQLFFFWIYFAPTPFTEWNIPVVYYRIQQIGYPVVLLCSLIWLNRNFFPQQGKFLLISAIIFLLEWFRLDRIFIQ